MKVDLQLYKDFYSWDKYKEGAECNYYTIIFGIKNRLRMPIDIPLSSMSDYSDEDYMEYVEDSEFVICIPDDFYYTGSNNPYINASEICDDCYSDFGEQLKIIIPKFGFNLVRDKNGVLVFVHAEENKK